MANDGKTYFYSAIKGKKNFLVCNDKIVFNVMCDFNKI